MANKVIVSKQGSINWRAAFKGLILAVGSPLLYLLQEMIPGYNLDPFVKAGISAAVTYLLQNFFQPASVITTYSNNAKAEAVKDNIIRGN